MSDPVYESIRDDAIRRANSILVHYLSYAMQPIKHPPSPEVMSDCQAEMEVIIESIMQAVDAQIKLTLYNIKEEDKS